MIEFIKELPLWQLILLGYIFGQGVVMSFKNTYYRVVTVFQGVYTQSPLGMMLDVIWYAAIFVFVVLNFL